MSGSCFIADLHLDPSRPAACRALARLLHSLRDCDALYILGDLFEAWVGDDDDTPLAVEVAALLSDFHRRGPALYLMHGNRDFLLGAAFCERAGATLIGDPTVIDLYGQPTLLMHGDSLCTDDLDYQQFRRQARSPGWQADVLQRPLAERRALARQLRARSHEAKTSKPSDITDVAPSAVCAAIAGHDVTQLIHGHTHRPGRHQLSGAVRWVVGDWHQLAWYLRVERSEIKLEYIVL